MTVKRTLLIVAILAIAVVMVPSVALANAGVHGAFTMNTDQCAGCHRTHTAPSSATWTDGNGNVRSALLLGDFAELQQFCLTCHGATAQGADTNVEEGVYEVRASKGAYGVPGQPLISGPFGVPSPTPDINGNFYTIDYQGKRVTSKHDYFGDSWAAWGGGIFGLKAGVGANLTYTASALPSVGVGASLIKMDCGTCHDVHGTSNYRLLKNQVYGVIVGGYDSAGNPTPWVTSNEPGFPAGGFSQHTLYPTYTPNYTKPLYVKGGASGATPADPQKGLSGWCVGCHTFYMGERGVSDATTYTADSFFGKVVRHRHPVNVPLANFAGPTSATVAASDETTDLPLAHSWGSTAITDTDWVDCMTCHFAHGTTAVMTGYANVLDPTNQVPDSGHGGVAPTDDSALLRTDNRFACQACHHK